MRVRELQSALAEIKGVFAAAGASAAERDLEAVLSLLADEGDRDLEAYLKEVREQLGGSPRRESSVSDLTARLIAAGLDEAKFKVVLSQIVQDATLGKAEVQDIAKQYGVIRLNTRSRAAIIESIEKHFYWMLINHDADAMAKRATPW